MSTSLSQSLSLKKSIGYLELIIGPMYSGKTSKLLEIYKQCKFCDISVCVINHSLDKRYHDSMLSSHDKAMIPCLNIENIYDLWFNNGEIDLTEFANKKNHTLIRNSHVILINEGQFFKGLHTVVYDMLKNNKIVYICGLDGDFERKKFGEILDLIPLCDKVTKLTSLCSLCKNGTLGIFSMRITNEKEQTVIGSDNYLPVCRNCYDKKN
jgi:thymidine kinase